jgi:hypothetical protein
MAIESYYLEELTSERLRGLLEALGGSASLTSGNSSRMAGRAVGKIIGDSIRSRVAAKLLELQDKYGDILSPKNALLPGPARQEYEDWYITQRQPDIDAGKKDEKHYRMWAHVHLSDTLKFRKELT